MKIIEICGFKPFSWQKSRIFFVAMTGHPRGFYVQHKASLRSENKWGIGVTEDISHILNIRK